MSVLHCHGVLVWRRAVFSTGGSTTGKRLAKLAKGYSLLYRVSEGTLNTFLVRFRGVSVLHCHGVLVWRRAVISTGFRTTGKGWQNWQKAIFNRVSEGTLDTFLVRFRGVSVLHCHGVLVWRMAFFSTGGSTTGKGWQNWQKTIFNRVSEGTLDIFLLRFRGVSVLHCHGVLVWRRAVFSTGGSTTGKGWQNWQKAIFNGVSEGTLNTFWVRFRGVSVLHCHGVLVWRRAVFSSGFSTTGKGWQNWQKAIFNRVSEGTLDTFWVRFRGASVVHCHCVLVWRRAVFSTGGKRFAKLAKGYF